MPERERFARSILNCEPKRIVDLGCGPGLWLELLNGLVSEDCEFIGIDSDNAAIDEARIRANGWSRKVQFLELDIEKQLDEIPEADLFLAFNVFPYLTNSAIVLDAIRLRLCRSGLLVLRQYDGALLRFGPLDQTKRSRLDNSLQASILGSDEFRHYDLDFVFQAVGASRFQKKEIKFELFQRTAPYPPEFVEYLTNTVEWTIAHTAEDISEELRQWLSQNKQTAFQSPSYFIEVDMVTWLS